MARFEYDGFLADDDGNEIDDASRTDVFLGFGPGYRVINTPNQAWRVQAGPGIRYVKQTDTNSDTEVGFIVTSRYFYGISDTVSFSMDTDVLGSDTDTIVTNDAGVNYKLTNNLSTRVSLRTEYNTDPIGSEKSTDNTFGVSLVLGF